MNRGFAFYENYYASMTLLPEDLKMKLGLAIIEYGMEGKRPEDPVIAALLQGMIPSIDNSVERFNSNSENGNKGGRPSKATDEDIAAFLAENPKATAQTIADHFGMSASAVQKREPWKNRKNLATTYQEPSNNEWKF